MIHINDFFDEIYLINLPRRPEKLTSVLWKNLNLYKIKVKVIKAIDGYQPDIYALQNKSPPGAYGYLLSWKKVLQDAQEKQYQKILILDDDVILCKDFNTKFNNFITTRPPAYWKIILFGASQHTDLPQVINKAYHPLRTDGSFSVALRGTEIIKDILTEIKNGGSQYVDSDILRKFYRKYQLEGSCLVAYPNLMIADVSHSDIREGRNLISHAQKVKWNNLDNYHLNQKKNRKLPLVSIIVPCYNAEKTIRRCLISLKNQTYRPLNIIVVNDGSKDQSLEIIGKIFNEWLYSKSKEFEFSSGSDDFSFKLIHHQKNQGCYHARNTGIKEALEIEKADFIAFQDSDDISLDFRIWDQVNALLSKNVEMVTCQILRTHLSSLDEDPIKLFRDIERTRIHDRKYCCRAKVGLVTTLFKKECIQKLGLYRQDWRWGADAEYLRRLFPKVNREIKMMNYLDAREEIKGKYYQVKEILYLSHEMTENNLTSLRKKHHQEKSK